MRLPGAFLAHMFSEDGARYIIAERIRKPCCDSLQRRFLRAAGVRNDLRTNSTSLQDAHVANTIIVSAVTQLRLLTFSLL